MKIVAGITGASGLIYADRLLRFLASTTHETSVVVSNMARKVNEQEKGLDLTSINLSVYDDNDFTLPFISGSNPCDAMVVVPCSMATLGKIAHGIADTVITRTADVCLKERRPLVVVPRETPYNLVHVKNMELLLLGGARVVPASPSFYTRPAGIDDLVNTVISRILDNIGIENSLTPRWTGRTGTSPGKNTGDRQDGR